MLSWLFWSCASATMRGRVSPRRVWLVSGCASDSAVTFFCFAKRKSPKKRRAGFVGPALRYSPPHYGVGGTRYQTGYQDQPPTSQATSLPSFPRRRESSLAESLDSRLRGNDEFEFGSRLFCRPTPSDRAEQRRGRWIRAGVCLSAASSRQTPPDTSSARNRAAALSSARLLFAYFLLAKQEKVGRPPGRIPAYKSQPKQTQPAQSDAQLDTNQASRGASQHPC